MKNLKLVHLLLCFFCISGFFAQDEKSLQRLMELPIKKTTDVNGDIYLQGNFTEILYGKHSEKKNFTPLETHDHAFGDVRMQIANAPHPSLATIRKHLRNASVEFKVPFEILDAIAKTYNNYSMIGPSEYGTFGVMGLLDNSEVVNTAEIAAKLINSDVKTLKSNVKEEIRASAALLSYYAGVNKNSINVIDWFTAVKDFSGMIDEETKEMQAINYFEVLNNGRKGITLWKESAEISALNNRSIANLITEYYAKLSKKNSMARDAVSGTVDYPAANAAFTDCNFGTRNSFGIDTYVNHYIAVGTVASTISFFRQCRPNAPTSAHFVVGLNGQVYQMVPVAKNAYHCGASGFPNNNHRSIGTEHEVTSSTPDSWNNTNLLKASTDLARFFCNLYNISKTRSLPGIRGHKEMPGSNTDCPFTIPWTTWMDLLVNSGNVNNLPVAVNPAANATNVALPITFTHTSPVNATSFRIQVSTSNTGWTATDGFTTASSPTSTIVVNASISGLSFNWAEGVSGVFEGPKFGTTYYYTIRSYDTTTGTSKYTAVKTFSTAFGATLISPANAANVATPVQFSWTSNTASASYRLQVSKVNTGWTATDGFSTATTTSANLPVNYSAANLVNYTWPNSGTTTANLPVANTTYYWTVRLFSTATGSSKYTPVRSFKTNASTARLASVLEKEIKLYPNPSSGEMAIAYEASAENNQLYLFDLKGNEVFSKKLNNKKGKVEITENIEGLMNGNYILKIVDGENVINQNVMIKN